MPAVYFQEFQDQRSPGANREKENNWIVVHQVKMQQIRSLMAAEG